MSGKFFLVAVFFFTAVTVACGNEKDSKDFAETNITENDVTETQISNTKPTQNINLAEEKVSDTKQVQQITIADADPASKTESTSSTEDAYADIKDRLQTCAACHGENGASVIPANPILAGQEFYYLYVQLKDIKSGLRESAIMTPIVADIEKEEMKRLAEYYSKQIWPETIFKSETKDINAGKSVVTAGQCVACHLGAFNGNSRVPRMAGQHAEYLANTMLDFKSKVRKNSPAKGSLLASFSDEDIQAVAKYLAGFNDE